MGTMKVIGSALYQWELGRKLRITPPIGTKAVEVQFAHIGDTEALSVTPKEENGIIVAEIPNILLQSGQEILAFLVHVDSQCVETTSHKVFRVVNRPKPADYTYEETEVLSWRDLYASVQEFMEEIRKELESGDFGGAPSDWNAAEGEPGHVLNRTHWGESTVFADGEYTSVFVSSFGLFGCPLNGDLETIPKNMSVVFDGVRYNNINHDEVPGLGFVFGNLSYLNATMGTAYANTGEPFIAGVSNSGMTFFTEDTESTKHTITVIIGEIHKLDGKYLPNGVPYVEGGGEPVELLPPTKLEGVDSEFSVPADAGIVLVDGGNYVVNWNGTEYTCTAQYFEMNGESATVIGNIGLAMGGEDTGEPFVIMYQEALVAMGVSLYVVSLDGAAEVTLGLVGSPPVKIHKLDNKFLDLDWKPKYTETLLVPECTIAHNESLDVGVAVSPKDNQTFVVYCDGIRYVARGYNDMDITGLGDPTGGTMPFFIATFGTSIVLNHLGGGTHTISIYSTSVPRMPSDMMPDDLATLTLCSDGEYIYTDSELTTRIRGEALRDSMRTRRIIIEYAGAQFEVLRTEPVIDNAIYYSGIGATVVWKDGDTMTFKTLKSGPI